MISEVRLTNAQRRWRIALLSVAIVGALVLRALRPEQIGHVWPFAMSCGAVTGLPCVFCGFTRAMHYLLNGDLGRALYFNWLAFPFTIGLLGVAGAVVREIVTATRVLQLQHVQMTRRRFATAAATMLALWAFNAWLAVTQHKTELLNPTGPLYALFVR